MISEKQEIFLKDILSKMCDYMSYHLYNQTLTIDGYIPSFHQDVINRIKIIKLNIPSLNIETTDKELLKFLKKK